MKTVKNKSYNKDYCEWEKQRLKELDSFVYDAVYRLQFLWRYFNTIREAEDPLHRSGAEVNIVEEDMGLNFLTYGTLTEDYPIPHDDFASIEYALYELFSKAKEVYFEGDEDPFTNPELKRIREENVHGLCKKETGSK